MGKIRREKRIVEDMIRFYCEKKHRGKKPLCNECTALLIYAHQRLDSCPQGEEKTSCRKCATHCYVGDKRMGIKKVMGYSGPRMMIYKPGAWVRHIFS